MRRKMNVTINEGFSQVRDLGFNLEGVFEQILYGALEVTNGGSTRTYTDLWSGGRIEITKDGRELESADIFAPVQNGAGTRIKKVAEIDFPNAAPNFNAIRDALQEFHDSSGANNPFDLVSRYQVKLKHEDTGRDGSSEFGPSFFFKGKAQNDDFWLGNGFNFLQATDGNDIYNGRKGFDTVDYTQILDPFSPPGTPGITTARNTDGPGVLVQKPGDFTDTLINIEGINGTAGDDNLRFPILKTGIQVNGGGGDDTLGGARGDDDLRGGAGDDLIIGKGGDDILFGDNGADIIRGGGGNDILFGASAFGDDGSRDVLIGGGGKDLNVISTPFGSGEMDLIRGFKDGQDFIGLNGGLSFNDLALEQQGQDVDIFFRDEVIARVLRTDLDDFSRSDFVESADFFGGGVF